MSLVFDSWDDFVYRMNDDIKYQQTRSLMYDTVIIKSYDPLMDAQSLLFSYLQIRTLHIEHLVFGENIESLADLFSYNDCIVSINIMNIHTVSPIFDVNHMFAGDVNLKFLRFPLNFFNVINASHMFKGCVNLSILQHTDFNFSEQLRCADKMFSSCYNISPEWIKNLKTYGATTKRIFNYTTRAKQLLCEHILKTNNKSIFISIQSFGIVQDKIG